MSVIGCNSRGEVLKILNFKPADWLFPGSKKGSHITERTVQKIFKVAAQKAGIIKEVSVHNLRNFFPRTCWSEGLT
ncbi:tyrosine-type recombinase/integrase [Candidatus Contubernalis alkaliaceticus]|uniref:tyrosine-type recombinase/integrase n=1 Tax=Candidatus Contubernalis alkaliaceticus TaxID=338645 RepID=UPI002409FAA8